MSVEGVARRALVFALTAAVVLSVVAGGALGGPLASGGPDGPGVAAAQSDDSDDGGEGNESTPPPHRNPEEVREDGDIAGVEAALAGWLGTRVGESVIAINEEEYERGRELIGDEYDDALGQFVEVTRETGNEETADRFEDASNGSRDLANESEEFAETYEEYQEARENGDEEQARRLARDLDEQAAEINETARELNATFGELETLTGEDFSDAQAAALETAADREAIAEEATRETLTETRLTVTANRTSGSFLRPVGLTGRLTTEEGVPVANETVQVAVADRVYDVETDAAGQFRIAYRPIRLPVPTEGLPVAFRPAGTSPYTGATAEAAVRIEGVTPTAAITNAPDTVAFDEQVAVAGWVTAGPDETPVPGVPVVATIDGVVIASGTTDADGRYRIAGRLPASILAGDTTLRVRVDQKGRAVGTDAHEVGLAVRSTDTSLSVNAEVAEGQVRTAGRLTTADGTPLGLRTVQLLVNGTVVGTAETDGDGVYRTTIDLPAGVAGGDAARVTVAFDGAGTSLADASATAVVSLPTAGPGDGATELQDRIDANYPYPLGVWLLIAFIAALGLLGGVAPILRRAGSGGDGGETSDIAAGGVDDSSLGGEAASGKTSDQFLLDRARERLASDGAAAVRTAYGAVRRQVGEQADVPASATHWELYLAARDRLDSDRGAALERLTEAYERAEFAPTGIDGADAEAAVEAAAAVLER